MIQVYVLVSFWDDNGLHKAGTFTEVKEENFNPYYMQKVDSGSVDAYTKEETNQLLSGKQDDLTAGTNIQISDEDVISATDTGDTVSVTQVQSTGTKIATITVNSVGTDVYAPDALVISCSGIVKNLVASQSYPGSMSFSTPVAKNVITTAISAGTPIVFKFQDGYLMPDTIFADVTDDNKIRGTFTVGYDTTDGTSHTSSMKIITFQFIESSDVYPAMFVADATPSGGGSSATRLTILDSGMGPVNATDITSSSMSSLTIVNYDTSDELSYSDIVDLCLAGKVYFKFETSQYAYQEYTYGVIDSFGQPLESSPSTLGLIHFTIIKGTGNANFKNVTLAYGGNKWSSTTW